MYVDILQKDYEGPAFELEGAFPAFSISYNEEGDGHITPFKTSTAELIFINPGGVPLENFYSEDDEEWKIEFRDGSDNTLRWAGYLVQDDCEEDFTDAPYLVTLAASDNIGLTKDITLDEAVAKSYIDIITRSGTNTDGTLLITSFFYDPELAAGDTIYIGGNPYEISGQFYNAIGNRLFIYVINPPGNGIYDISFNVRGNLVNKHTLFSFIRLLLESTGINLPLRIFNNLFEAAHDEGKDMFAQTRIFTGKWLTEDGDWSSVYDIAEEILTTFNATLQQADGFWNVIRWGEAYRYENNEIDGFEYDDTYKNPQPVTLTPNFDTITPATDNELINADARKSILRPLKSVKETFNYDQPRELIRNLNLAERGELLRTYADGVNTVREYKVPHWFPLTSNPDAPDFFMRVIFDDVDVEVEHYLVLKGGIFGGAWYTSSNFYMNTDDRVSVSMQMRTSDSQSGPSTNSFAFRLDSETDTKYMSKGTSDPDGTWRNGASAVFFYNSDTNIQNWQSFSAASLGAPFDGYFSIGLQQLDFDDTINETHYKDISIVYTPYVSDITAMKGHYHLDEITNLVKNKYDEEITIDDTPKNAIQGTLFLDVLDWVGQYQTRTSAWGFKGETKNRRLGQIITKERHSLQRISRALIDCNFVFDCPLLTTMNILFLAARPGRSFIFGVITFEYSNFTASARLWELYSEGETEITSDYTYKYIFDTK